MVVHAGEGLGRVEGVNTSRPSNSTDYATVGTANFDNRSFRLNFEITIAAADTDFAAEVGRMLGE